MAEPYDRRNVLCGLAAMAAVCAPARSWAANPLKSVTAPADALDAYIRLRMDREHIPGLSLAIVKDGKPIAIKGYGYADLEWNVPAGVQTVYQIGSMSKQFTSAAILILAQDNKLGLDDIIGKYIDGAPQTWNAITVRHLLTHTSGLPLEGLPATEKTFFADYTKDDLITSAKALSLLSPPGTKYRYGNLDYDLLAIIIEKVSGVSYAEFLQQRIFGPLRMTSTRVNDRRAIIANRAQAYLWDHNSLQKCEPQVSPTRYYGSASLMSTVMDLAKWDASLYTDRILNAASRKAMWTPTTVADGTVTAYGFGWELSSVKGHARLYHTGAMDGFVGNISRFVDDRLTIIVLTNQSGLSNPLRIATGVARLYIPAIRPAIQGGQPARVYVDKTVMASAAGRYEYWRGFMLTLTPGKGVLLGQLPVGEADDYVPVSTTAFWQAEEGIQLTVVKTPAGEVTGLVVRQDDGSERTIPRIGPLFDALKLQPDPDPKRSQRIEAALIAIVQGGKAVADDPGIAPGMKTDSGAGTADFAGMRACTFLAEENVVGRGIERHGAEVSRVLYYRMNMDKLTGNLLVYVTADGLLTDYDIVDN
ncbi:serine hydrolase domain-containing protein [Asticcacaulis sp. 201]|uniref:serine hydrolase domain-containing protein n=1 Tax=Asticcacaulis sp. 201 TaxID=3028787 RepID=UPI002916635C|nr:serine hydrolase domain-containing protein [Asticcacaulis sp. 201]MDV6329988.1 serine hydrolase domain-containing protein [Asticcacaulis sp. 201]